MNVPTVETFGQKVLHPKVEELIDLATELKQEAPSHGIPIHLHDPNSNGGQDYQQVSSVLESRWGL